MCMGGRIAEELIIKDITTGASGDINHATKLAHDMVYRYGMSKRLGFMSLDTSEQVFIGRDYQTKNAFSDKLAAEADDEIREILDYNYKRAKKILADNVSLMHEMVKLLLERETIYKQETDLLLEGKSADEVLAIMEKKDKEQKEKEAKQRETMQKEMRLASYRQKDADGEKLLVSGIITQEEYEAIKKEYEVFAKEIEKEEAKPEVQKPAKVEEKKTIENKTPVKRTVKPKSEKEADKKPVSKKKSTDKKDDKE